MERKREMAIFLEEATDYLRQMLVAGMCEDVSHHPLPIDPDELAEDRIADGRSSVLQSGISTVTSGNQMQDAMRNRGLFASR
jgi:hypothetical protein